VTGYTVTGLANGTTYYFVITASNTSGTSANSGVKTALPIVIPTAPVLNIANVGNAKVSLAWNPVIGATSYSVKYGTAPGVYGTSTNVGNVTGYTVTGLTNGTTYYFVVTATNSLGTSGNSVEKSVIPRLPPSYVSHVEYNSIGQKTLVQYGNGVSTTYSYDPKTFRLVQVYTVNALGIVIQNLSYKYDALGQVMAIKDTINSGNQIFKYDFLNRLTDAQGSYGAKVYAYDVLGNLKVKDGLTYNYGELNSRTDGTKAGPHAVTSLSDGSSFKYDANGNMVSVSKLGKITTYVYDAQNRLITVRNQNGTQPALLVAEYTYDGDGGRTRKKVYRRDLAAYSMSVDSMLFYTYGYNLPATSANTTVEITRYVGALYEDTGTRQTKYIYLGGTRVAAADNLGNVFYYHTDHLGGTNVLTDALGLQREETEYDPFGLVIRHDIAGAPNVMPWHYFTGKTLDDESGLLFYGARYYNPKLGRFITPDTIVQSPGNPQTLNRYTYCNNNPINLIDPTGHSWLSKVWDKVEDFGKKYGGTIISVAFTLVGMPFIGALVSSAFSTIVNRGSFRDFAMSFGVGLATGYAGGTIAGGVARSMGMNMAGLWTAVFRGALAGSIAGAGSAAIFGGNIGQGALMGGAMGGVMGAMVWGVNEYKTNQFLKNNVDWDSSVSPQERVQMIQSIRELGQSPMGQREFAAVRASGQKLSLYSYHGPNSFVNSGTNNVHLNPDVKGMVAGLQGAPAYNQLNTMDLATLAGHEFGHTMAVSGGMGDPFNVSYHENMYRSWVGQPSRTGYYSDGDIPFRSRMFQY